ncbi:hypothetical protein Lalb_Chr17g0345301 [Lupinus albus]|uniref:Uncharacterized protein n=1 Tax=Lupinus albus TaxID=3870 RepID=A0A6A4P3M7_LUPAL|nr:hypothetical protein Lalb_Chr17g0345301 [Lupinus albus]
MWKVTFLCDIIHMRTCVCIVLCYFHMSLYEGQGILSKVKCERSKITRLMRERVSQLTSEFLPFFVATYNSIHISAIVVIYFIYMNNEIGVGKNRVFWCGGNGLGFGVVVVGFFNFSLHPHLYHSCFCHRQ